MQYVNAQCKKTVNSAYTRKGFNFQIFCFQYVQIFPCSAFIYFYNTNYATQHDVQPVSLQDHPIHVFHIIIILKRCSLQKFLPPPLVYYTRGGVLGGKQHFLEMPTGIIFDVYNIFSSVFIYFLRLCPLHPVPPWLVAPHLYIICV